MGDGTVATVRAVGRAGRHAARRRGLLRPHAPRWPVVAASAVITLALLATSEIGGTAAFLNASASTAPAASVITSGTADLTLSPLSLPAAALYPGLTLYGAVTATNTGDVPLTLRVSGLTTINPATNPLSASLVVGVGVAASAAACAAGSVTPGWTGTVAAQAAGPIGVTLRAGTPQVLCVSVALPTTAPTTSQGQSAANVGLRVAGTAE